MRWLSTKASSPLRHTLNPHSHLIAAQSQAHHNATMEMAQISPSRTPSTRAPPVIPPGMPVKSGHLGTFKSQHAQKIGTSSPPAAPSPPRKKSSVSDLHLANLRFDPKRLPPVSDTPSPVGSYGSIVEKDSSRGSSTLNVGPGSMRSHGSSTRSAEGCQSPEEPDLVTPKEQYTPQVQVQDGIESQFEHLLVRRSCRSILPC